MTKEKETQQGITRTETKKSANGMILEEKHLAVYGSDLKEIKEVFGEEWKK